MKPEQQKTISAVAQALGAGSWLMLLSPPVWWAGFGCVLAALFLSWRVLRSGPRKQAVRIQAGIALASAAAAAAVCIVFLQTAPTLIY